MDQSLSVFGQKGELVKLAPPVFLENLSVCSRAVRLSNQLRGATIEVYVDGLASPIATGVADWSDQWFDLLSTAALLPGQVVRALQKLGGDISPRTTVGVTVQDRSSASPQFAAPLTACSELAVVTATAPGATVTIRDAGGRALGSSPAPGSRAEVKLSRMVGLGEQLNGNTNPCGGTLSPSVQSLPAERIAPQGRFDVPNLINPPLQCQRTIHFGNTRPGAILNLQRAGTVITWQCTATELKGRIDPALVAGETVTFWLEAPFLQCETGPSDKVTAAVASDPPPQPTLSTSPCIGTKLVIIGGLVEDSIVTVRADGDEVCVFGSNGGSQQVDLGNYALGIGQIVTVTQALCAVASPESVGLPVTNPDERFGASFTDHPVACGLAIRLRDVLPGTYIEVQPHVLRGRIGWAISDDNTSLDILVSPPLTAGDDITCSFSGCGGGTLRAHVKDPTDLRKPGVRPPVERDTSVYVYGLVPGSMIDVTVDGSWAGGLPTGGKDLRVSVGKPLGVNQVVQAFARLCNQQRPSDQVHVVAAPDIVWSQPTRSGIAVGGGNFHSGRVTAVVALEWGALLLGTEAGGAWVVSPGLPALSLSFDWSDARALSLTPGPRGLATFIVDSRLVCSKPTPRKPYQFWRGKR
jgi:hypothetical protein